MCKVCAGIVEKCYPIKTTNLHINLKDILLLSYLNKRPFTKERSCQYFFPIRKLISTIPFMFRLCACLIESHLRIILPLTCVTNTQVTKLGIGLFVLCELFCFVLLSFKRYTKNVDVFLNVVLPQNNQNIINSHPLRGPY